MIIELKPANVSEQVRVGLGLTLLAPSGAEVRGYVTHEDYGRVARLTDGTTGILRRQWSGSQYNYALEVE